MRIKTSLSIRMPSGKFPPGSYAAALRPAKADLERDSLRAFEEKKDPVTGRAWPPRKAVYRHPMLRKTLTLFRGVMKAIASATLTGSTLTVAVIYPRYWRWHQFGTRRMKARRTVGVSPKTRAALARRLRGEGVKLITGRRGK